MAKIDMKYGEKKLLPSPFMVQSQMDDERVKLVALGKINEDAPEPMKLDLVKIGDWMVWIQMFLEFFTKYFFKNGEYKKPGILRWPGIVGTLFVLGIKLVGLFKSK